MKTIFHSANSRGHANHGWLDTYHSFSFANYYNPERMNFGALRVLNDDTVDGGMGFGRHPHKNMEIITIPLEGSLRHGDDMGNSGVIKKGQVQVMSAGTGVVHSEMNADATQQVKFLQIWILPDKNSVAPRYGELDLSNHLKDNSLTPVISPDKEENTLWIHQNARLFWGSLKSENSVAHEIKDSQNGIYIFNLHGTLKVGDQELKRRDSLGIWEADKVTIESTDDSEFIVIEVPMSF